MYYIYNMKNTNITLTDDREVVLYTYKNWEGETITEKCFPYSELPNLMKRTGKLGMTTDYTWDIDWTKYFNTKEELENSHGIPIVGMPKFRSNRQLEESGIGTFVRKGFEHHEEAFSDCIDLHSGFRNREGLITLLGKYWDYEYPENTDKGYTMKDLFNEQLDDLNIMLNCEYINY